MIPPWQIRVGSTSWDMELLPAEGVGCRALRQGVKGMSLTFFAHLSFCSATVVMGLGGAPAGSQGGYLGGGVSRTWSCMGGRDTGLARSRAGWCPALLHKTCPTPQPVPSPSPLASSGAGGTGPGMVMHGGVKLSQFIPQPTLVPAKPKHDWLWLPHAHAACPALPCLLSCPQDWDVGLGGQC